MIWLLYSFQYLLFIKGGGCPESKDREDNEVVGLGTTFYCIGKKAVTNGLYIITFKNNFNNISYKLLYYILTSMKNIFIKNFISTFNFN